MQTALLLALVTSTLAAHNSSLIVPSATHPTLDSAIADAANGDTIFVVADYVNCGTVIVDKSVSIVGDKNPIMDCNSGWTAITAHGQKTAISITILGIQFMNGFSDSRGGGGAVHISGQLENVVIRNCSFSSNTVSVNPSSSQSVIDSGGGAVAIVVSDSSTGANIDISGCSFTSNSAPDGLGGHLLVYFASDAANGICNLSNNTFMGGTARFGGGIAVWLNGTATNASFLCDSSSFVNNSETALFVLFAFQTIDTALSLGNDASSFINNTAPGGEGGINVQFSEQAVNTSVSIGNHGSTFVGNSAGAYGAIHIGFYREATNTSLEIGNDRSSFINNTGDGGGAIMLYLHQAIATSLSIGNRNSTFWNNTASSGDGGGAVNIEFLMQATNTLMAIGDDSASFIDNSGGSILVWFKTLDTKTSYSIGNGGSVFVPKSTSFIKHG